MFKHILERVVFINKITPCNFLACPLKVTRAQQTPFLTNRTFYKKNYIIYI